MFDMEHSVFDSRGVYKETPLNIATFQCDVWV